MSGWDVSSTPTWGSQDGPDETQAFTASGGGTRGHSPDFGAPDFGSGYPGDNGGYPGENMAGGPPPEYFGQDYGQEADLPPGGYPQRTPGQSFEDLPRRESARGRRGMPADGGYGQGGGYAQDGTYAQDGGYGQEWGGGGADQADGWGPGGRDDGGWGQAAGRSAAPWDERPPRDAGFGGPDGNGFGHQEFGRPPEGYPPQDYPGQDYPGQDYAGQDYAGQQGRGGQAPMEFGRQERDMVARNDPALQDFFAPAGGDRGFSGAGPGWAGGEPPRERFRPDDEEVDWTGRPKARPPADADADVDWTGRPRGQRPSPRAGRGDDDDSSGGLGMKGLVAIGAVVIVVIAVGAYMLLHKGGSSTPTASTTPTGMASAPAKPSGHATAGTGAGAGGAAAAAYTLVTPLPAKAGGYAVGQDPNDLANAKATAKQVVTAVTAGGGGTVKGNPESAAYTLLGSQAITFVGYQGTFTPTKVASILKSLGSDANTYPAGPNEGVLGCANTTTKPSGAVCVWATSSTLGITEFYDATGPETLNAAQSKGAADTLKLRADVEKKAS